MLRPISVVGAAGTGTSLAEQQYQRSLVAHDPVGDLPVKSQNQEAAGKPRKLDEHELDSRVRHKRAQSGKCPRDCAKPLLRGRYAHQQFGLASILAVWARSAIAQRD
jgi:hypothetical protein